MPDIRQELERQREIAQRKLEFLDNAIQEYEQIEQEEHGMNQQGRNQGNQNNRGNQGNRSSMGNSSSSSSNRGSSGQQGNSNRGRQNFADSNDGTDDRTIAGRQDDDQEFSQQELMEFLRNPSPDMLSKNDDQKYDLRTKEGRALQAAGLVDDDGYAVQTTGRGGNRGNSNR